MPNLLVSWAQCLRPATAGFTGWEGNMETVWDITVVCDYLTSKSCQPCGGPRYHRENLHEKVSLSAQTLSVAETRKDRGYKINWEGVEYGLLPFLFGPVGLIHIQYSGWVAQRLGLGGLRPFARGIYLLYWQDVLPRYSFGCWLGIELHSFIYFLF